MRFVIDDMAKAVPPTEEELKLWFNTHKNKDRGVDRYDTEQIYFSVERRGTTSKQLAKDALEVWRGHRVTPGGAMNHRNVIFRTADVPDQPVTT